MDSTPERCYLDNAATSWPKPEPVYAAVDDYLRRCGAAVGRGATRQGTEVQKLVDQCRLRAARLLGVHSPRHVLFTLNATDGLNLALHGLVSPGDHIVTTVMEHNSVLRPLRSMARDQNVTVTYVTADGASQVAPDDIRRALTPNTRLVVAAHASNVTGTIQPVADFAAIAREAGAFCVIDAAQTAGHLPLSVADIGADVLVTSGHKGLLGPLGTGLVCLRPGIEEHLRPMRQGGTGSHSENEDQPETLPDRYEAGNHNAPGIVGLNAALGWVEEHTVAAIRAHEQDVTQRLLSGLGEIRGVHIHGPADAEGRTGVVSITIDGWEPQDVALVLDEQFGVEVRAGLHCAPRAHAHLQTAKFGGTLRFSSGPSTTAEHIDRAAEAIGHLMAGR